MDRNMFFFMSGCNSKKKKKKNTIIAVKIENCYFGQIPRSNCKPLTFPVDLMQI